MSSNESIEKRLAALGIELPPIFSAPAGMNFLTAMPATGPLLFLSGHGPTGSDGKVVYQGRVGKEVSFEQAYQAARLTGLNLLATIRQELGGLDRVTQIVKVLGMVNAVEGFEKQPQVINGASDLFVEVFGDKIGRHARSAIGVGSLPFNMPVEIEMIVQYA
ncbi:MAG TPA: RidA family protein [Chloroflexia bacterium]|nr:RidA family protein [Chloroflexia bacterium]